jgi:TetR/AcrR family transcriptional repressor of nem operon
MKTLRDKLLDTALIEIKKNGYSGTSISDILNIAGGKKGSLYHHFKSKKDLILKVVEERIFPDSLSEWKVLEEKKSNHLDNLITLLKDSSRRDFVNGCVLGTLIQEISCEDEDFNNALNKVVDAWKKIFEKQIEKAKNNKEIKDSVNSQEVSIFLISILQGAMLVSKMKGTCERYNQCINQMVNYLNVLRI